MGTPRYRRPASAVGAVLRRLRGSSGLSQISLAGMAGISARHLGFVELGRSRPSEALLGRLADSLELTPGQRIELLLAGGYAPGGLRPGDLIWSKRVLDACPLAICCLDPELRVVLANEAHARLVGAESSDAMLGADLRRDRIWRYPAAREAIRRCLADGEPASGEVRGSRRGRGTYRARADVAPLFGAENDVVGVRILLRELPGAEV